MAVLHATTLLPGKLELITDWLPSRPWYRGSRTPQLQKSGGFRLDDTSGEVGIEVMFVTDEADDEPVTYQVPMAYRAAARPGADGDLIGTAEHGVLGARWIYDAARDQVGTAQLLALLAGTSIPQAQSVSDTPEPAVTVAGPVALDGPVSVEDREDGTALRVGDSVVHILRVLSASPVAARASVTAPWTMPDGTAREGSIVVLS